MKTTNNILLGLADIKDVPFTLVRIMRGPSGRIATTFTACLVIILLVYFFATMPRVDTDNHGSTDVSTLEEPDALMRRQDERIDALNKRHTARP